MSRHRRKEVAVGPQYERALVPFLKVVKRPGSHADILDALRKFVEANEGTQYLSPGWRKFFLVSSADRCTEAITGGPKALALKRPCLTEDQVVALLSVLESDASIGTLILDGALHPFWWRADS